MKNLKKIIVKNWVLEKGNVLNGISLFYQTFGQELGEAPVVLVNHALTGNSNVTGSDGWWNELIGENKTIDTNSFTILAFNIPGNGYDNAYENLIFNYKDFTAKDIAALFWKGVATLKIDSLFAVIGGSLGGGIAWEMAALQPNKIENLIPIATDWKATDWVIANVLVQDQILNNSDDPIADARLHAMLLYRTPQSLQLKFNRSKSELSNVFQIENWLISHGFKLQKRFRLASYKLMNHLLKTIDITKGNSDFITIASAIQANIHLIAVDSDLFFIAKENQATFSEIQPLKSNVFYHEIKSIHGHDAFLIEFEQLSKIIAPIFNTQKKLHYVKA
jgi:homoserine O-acetyltransferase